MGFILPAEIQNLGEGMFSERLHPPQVFASGIEHNPLGRLGPGDAALNGIDLIGAALVCFGSPAEDDRRRRIGRATAAAKQEAGY